jgi:hypothetical protein
MDHTDGSRRRGQGQEGDEDEREREREGREERGKGSRGRWLAALWAFWLPGSLEGGRFPGCP